MRFGWHGFSFEHPEDWVPTAITGDRKQGYVRLASLSKHSCQIRWQVAKSAGDLDAKLRAYFARLHRDAKRARVPFRSDSEPVEGRIDYRYSAQNFARGTLFFSEPSRRIFFVEWVSDRKDSLLSPFRQLISSFEVVAPGEPEVWALFGLDLCLPSGLDVHRRLFQSGRTQVVLQARGVQITADRWAFGEQLAARHGLETWARAALRMEGADLMTEPQGLRFVWTRPMFRNAEALVYLDQDQNQLIAVRVDTRKPKWRPEWDWIRSSNH